MADKLEVTADDFENNGRIPPRYTGDGEDISPGLKINSVSPEAESIAIICDDPDAPIGNFTHWLIWNIPANTSRVSPGIPQTETVDSLNGAVQGRNDFGELGYRGPAPPSGTHTYRFQVYTLDTTLDLPAGANKDQLLEAVKNHILQQTTLKGNYSRS